MAIKSSRRTGTFVPTCAIHVLLQLFNGVVRDCRRPFHEEDAYYATSTDRSRHRARTREANMRLHSACHQAVVSLVAVWGVDMFHDDILDAIGGVVT